MLSVVVLERDPTLAWLYQEELQEAGFRVTLAPDLTSALAGLDRGQAHILVADPFSAGGPPRTWLPRLRRRFRGPVLLLDNPRAQGPPGRGLKALPKSSDLKPLISSLRTHALQLMWSNAAGTC